MLTKPLTVSVTSSASFSCHSAYLKNESAERLQPYHCTTSRHGIYFFELWRSREPCPRIHCRTAPPEPPPCQPSHLNCSGPEWRAGNHYMKSGIRDSTALHPVIMSKLSSKLHSPKQRFPVPPRRHRPNSLRNSRWDPHQHLEEHWFLGAEIHKLRLARSYNCTIDHNRTVKNKWAWF